MLEHKGISSIEGIVSFYPIADGTHIESHGYVKDMCQSLI